MQRPLIACLALCIPLPGNSAEELKFPTTPPTAPQNAAKTFHVLDGFEMQLIAAEPLVTDPVAITYDEDGRAYVCEMNDYPYTDKERHKHAQENPTDQSIGKVRRLTDTDGDGVFDKATVFAEGLSWPTGAACWKGGIFVTATPDVCYLKDTNGDGVADIRQKVFTGFKKLNVQAVMNNPIWGLDHRIYVAGGSNGDEIQRAPGSESVMPLPADFKPLSIKRNDFSFDPSAGDVRLESGGARFGNTFDDWGNRFLCNIRNPCQHVVLPYRYLARNPYLVVPSALNDCAEAGDQLPVYRTSPPEPWREFRAKRWVQEGSTLTKSELVGAGVVTSSAGITVYRGDAYPPEYRDFVFVADVAGNLFYRMKLVPDGVTFKAVQVDGTKNFCTSDDLWSRPVNFVNAPDGCLHVCDMYREVIEHPWSIPDDIHSAVDLLRGRDKGRLYRLAPRIVVPHSGGSGNAPAKTFKPRSSPKLSTFTTPDLVALLDHPNAWHRETAMRLLFERKDKAAVEPLRLMVNGGKTPQGRMHALWSLNGRDEFYSNMGLIENALRHDSSLMARRCAAALADDFLETQPQQQTASLRHGVLRAIEELSESDTASVGLATALTTVQAKGSLVNSLSNLVGIFGDDPWLKPMILHAAMNGYPLHLATALADPRSNRNPRINSRSIRNHKYVFALGELIASKGSPAQVSDAAKALPSLKAANESNATDWHPVITQEGINALVNGIAKGAFIRGLSVSTLSVDAEVAKWWSAKADESLELLRDPDQTSPKRIEALYLAWFRGLEFMKPVLENLLTPGQPMDLQIAVMEALNNSKDADIARIVLDAWPKLTPALRDKAASLLLSRTDRITKLLDAIEAKKILPSQLSAASKATLARQKTPALAERITKLIGDSGSSNRKEVITNYEPVLSMTGDTTRGAKIYETLCMVCHRHLDRGNDVGPNLGTIKAWTAEQILTNVLDPNREVSPNFALYIVETNDGRTLSGLITSETAGNLTLKRADGGTDTVLRSEIKSLTSPGISLMPEGLEAAITPQQMADLIAYLKQ